MSTPAAPRTVVPSALRRTSAALERIGERLIAGVLQACDVAGALVALVVAAPRPSSWPVTTRREFSRQCYYTGVKALGITSGIAVLVGLAAVMQGLLWLQLAGQSGIIGSFLALVVVREVAPLLACFIVLGRSGIAVAAESSVLKASGTVRGLEAMGIDPLIFIVLPRVASAVVSVLALSVLFAAVALASGYSAAALTGLARVGPLDLLRSVAEAMHPSQMVAFVAKAVIPSAVAFTICLLEGLRVRATLTEVPRVLPRAFVRSLAAVVTLNVLISLVVGR